MFVGFSKGLKRMGGFRIGVGLRLTMRNMWYALFALMFIGIFYLMWYMIVLAGWGLYYIMYGIYKIYYLMFKYAAIGIKKLYGLIKGKVQGQEERGR